MKDITLQSEIIRKNTSAIAEMQRQDAASRTAQERLAAWVTDFAGSMTFVYLHVIWFAVWIALNTNVLRLPPLTNFDPFPFQFLTLVVSLEAIFLATFVLIGQNQLGHQSERRADLDLQVNLLAEQKAAKTLEMLDHIGGQLDQVIRRFNYTTDAEVSALKVSPNPEDVLRVIEEAVKDETDEILREAVKDVTSEMRAVREEVKGFRGAVREVAEDVEEIKDGTRRRA